MPLGNRLVILRTTHVLPEDFLNSYLNSRCGVFLLFALVVDANHLCQRPSLLLIQVAASPVLPVPQHVLNQFYCSSLRPGRAQACSVQATSEYGD